MGGRGQRANFGGKGRKVKVLSARNLVSERERFTKEVDETLQALKELRKVYGEVVDDLRIAKLGTEDKNTLAFTNGKDISVNSDYFDVDKMTAAYDLSIKSGHHPRRGEKTALQAVIAHEMGHILTKRAAAKSGNPLTSDIDSMATKIVTEARKVTTYKGNVQMSSAISKYATASNAEAVAEAVADVYCNGNWAKMESSVIVNRLRRYLKGK